MPPDASEPTPIDPDAILRQPFTTVRKGYDPLEVQKYLMALAGELRAGTDRVRDLERRLAEVTRRADELEHLSPQRLTALLGEETAKVIEAANGAAADIRTKAEENVARMLRDAQDRSGQMIREAETVLERKTSEAEEVAAGIAARAEEHLLKARAEAESEVEAGRERGREVVTEAQRVRERLLRDLVRRRKTLRQQIEQLQAGRERLVEAFAVVRRHLDESTHELEVVLPEAKVAADAALQRAMDEADDALEDELAALTAEVEAGVQTEADEPATAIAGPDGEPIATQPSVSGDALADGTLGDELVAEGDVEAEAGLDLEAHGAGSTGPRAPDPVAGRHSSAVKVIAPAGSAAASDGDPATSSSTRVASLFARIRQEVEAEEVHGEPAARLIPTDRRLDDPDRDAGDLSTVPLDDRCSRVLGELERSVNRHVKRELSDEQNEMLDAVRRERSTPSAASVLADPEAHVERYASAAFAPLSDASVAGGQLLPLHAREPGDAPRVGGLAREVAAELAAELVAPLRGRLEACFVNCADDEDTTALSEALGACYREWRTQRVEPLAEQAVVAAFNKGVLAAAVGDAQLRWHSTAPGTSCQDCTRNAEGDGAPAGETFPSGHEAPPIHPGCRCLLVSDGS